MPKKNWLYSLASPEPTPRHHSFTGFGLFFVLFCFFLPLPPFLVFISPPLPPHGAMTELVQTPSFLLMAKMPVTGASTLL